jgi:phosphoglucosamine mutase
MSPRPGAPRFGTDGLRGVANTELTPELALALGRAAARQIGAGRFLLGRDTRRSGTMLAAALAAGLTAEGATVVDVGVIPTPGLAWLASDRQLPAAMISASHNPFADNGIKLLSRGGTKLADATERAIEGDLDALLGVDPLAALPDGGRAGGGVGEVIAEPGAGAHYVAHLSSLADLRGAKLRVLCDCANGAASRFAPAVLGRLGVDAVVVAADPNGTNINAGCGSTHADELGEPVRSAGAQCGLAFDGDADRLIALDESGRVIDGDHLLAMFAIDLHARGELAGDAVAVTVMSNLGLRRALAAHGIGVIETPVGDRHVADALEAHGLVLGGEQSGHLIFRRHATTGDGILTAVKLLELLVRRDEPLSALAAVMQRLPQQLRNVAVRQPSRLAEARAIWDEVAAVEAELRENGRVLLRASGTEATVRVMVEAETPETVAACVERLVAVVEAELGAPIV